MDCLFCKIVNKEIPSEIVYENDKILAFLDIKPTNSGHTLIIPKTHSQNMAVANGDDLIALVLAVKKLAPAIVAAVAADGWNLEANNGSAAGQLVEHTHWHVVPRFKEDGLRHWPGHPYAGNEMKTVGDKIRKAIG